MTQDLNISLYIFDRTDHRGIKKVTKVMTGFKSFEAAEATISGI
jgi:transposase-like protein